MPHVAVSLLQGLPPHVATERAATCTVPAAASCSSMGGEAGCNVANTADSTSAAPDEAAWWMALTAFWANAEADRAGIVACWMLFANSLILAAPQGTALVLPAQESESGAGTDDVDT